jgi:hypothetical protein
VPEQFVRAVNEQKFHGSSSKGYSGKNSMQDATRETLTT